MFQTRDRKIVVSKWLNIGLWMVSFAVMGSTVFCSRIFYLEGHDYNRLETSIFLAFSRSAWTVGVVWILWSCMHGYGGELFFVQTRHTIFLLMYWINA